MYCIFSFASKKYAIPTKDLLEIIPLGGLTRLPRSVPRLIGLHPYRGSVITIVSITPDYLQHLDESKYILVCSHDSGRMGILIEQVYAIEEADLRPDLSFVEQHLLGQMTYDNISIDVLNPAVVLKIEVEV